LNVLENEVPVPSTTCDGNVSTVKSGASGFSRHEFMARDKAMIVIRKP